MNINFDIAWKLKGPNAKDFDPRLLLLLRGIREHGSLRAAADTYDLSYRFAWGLIGEWNDYLGEPIVILKKGKGASLTAIGNKFLWVEQLLASRFSADLEEMAEELNKELASLLTKNRAGNGLTVYASNDLAINHLQELCNKSTLTDLDFYFRGSLESLRLLSSSNCDIAGFHFPSGKLSQLLAPLYQQWLDEKKHLLLHVVTREQGLMIQKKNLNRIKTLKDLSKRSVQFVNRQKESGTRTIFDELLKQEGIKKQDIRGYHDEEFTHVAVAAMVASGAATAGFGIKAAASKFGLGFAPLVKESYLLAINKSVAIETVDKLRGLLVSKRFKAQVNKLPGYNTQCSGKTVKFADLL